MWNKRNGFRKRLWHTLTRRRRNTISIYATRVHLQKIIPLPLFSISHYQVHLKRLDLIYETKSKASCSVRSRHVALYLRAQIFGQECSDRNGHGYGRRNSRLVAFFRHFERWEVPSNIANGDKQTFAKMVSYPLSRPYPLPDVETEGQMIRYFDTLFDKQFRQRIAKLDSNVDISTDHNPETEPSFRVAIFKKGTKASEVPAIVLLGERTIEGSMHLETLNFKSDKYTVVIVPEDVVDGKSYCSIYDRAGREVRAIYLAKSVCNLSNKHNPILYTKPIASYILRFCIVTLIFAALTILTLKIR